MGDNYSQLISRISEAAGLGIEDIERRIEAKRAKLSGLVSKEGAAQIVAAELGINFDQERLKISQLVVGMRKVNVIGKIIDISAVTEYNKNGKSGKVCSFRIADDSSNARVVLWDLHHISLIEQGKIGKGHVVEISNGSFRNGEIHLGGFSDIKKSKEEMKNVVEERIVVYKKLSEVKAGESFSTRAVIVQMFDPKYFEVCPECGKKVSEGKCAVHGEVKGKKRALVNIVIDDGSETIRSVLFGEGIKKLGITEEEVFSLEKFSEKKKEILGEEKLFFGNIRSNQVFNTNELNIDKIEDIDTSKLIAELESK
ncbi:MAG: hypothetical protein Q7S27_04415 [Nanoarchaeota archaeon]|nr:hypothetical protein [Nanoarchaeota archaeon]